MAHSSLCRSCFAVVSEDRISGTGGNLSSCNDTTSSIVGVEMKNWHSTSIIAHMQVGRSGCRRCARRAKTRGASEQIAA